MAFNDPIADLLTRVRNAKLAKHKYLDIYVSREKLNIIKILKNRNFINDFFINEKKKMVRIFLRYKANRVSAIKGLKRISKPSLRKYVGAKEIPTILNGSGIAIISTSKGVLDDTEAKENNVGGEVLCYIW